jgi:probable rRNA maturation factor
VLAFAMTEEEGAVAELGPRGPLDPAAWRGILGDVILSVETAGRQARQRGRPLLDELTMLLGHGLLHLLGYDHRTDGEEEEMTAMTRELEAAAAARTTTRRASGHAPGRASSRASGRPKR